MEYWIESITKEKALLALGLILLYQFLMTMSASVSGKRVFYDAKVHCKTDLRIKSELHCRTLHKRMISCCIMPGLTLLVHTCSFTDREKPRKFGNHAW
jgi:hypothetical protein